MARIGLTISVSGYTGKLLIRWLAASAPLSEIGRSDPYDFPYDAVYPINDLDPVVHIVQLWRSSDGSALDELIKQWEIDASIYNEASILKYQYKVDRGYNNTTPIDTGADVWEDPENGDTELIDERLNGATQDELTVHEAGYGNKLNSEYSLRTGGGIVLEGGATFNADTAWFIERSQVVAQQSTVVASQTLYSDVVVVTADRDLFTDSTDNLYNKLVIANKAGSVLAINVPDLATIPNNTKVTFNTHNGSQKYLKLQFDSGDSVQFFGVAKNTVYISKCQIISLYFKDGVCYLWADSDRYLYTGSVTHLSNASLADSCGAFLLADESTGELSKADYPGLYDFILNAPAEVKKELGTTVGKWGYSTVINGITVYPNKSYWGIDTVAETFRVRHLKGLVAKNVATGNYPGFYEHDQVGKLDLEIMDGQGGNATGTIVNTGFSGQDNARAFVDNGAIGAEKYIRSKNNENKIRTYGELPYIIL